MVEINYNIGFFVVMLFVIVFGIVVVVHVSTQANEVENVGETSQETIILENGDTTNFSIIPTSTNVAINDMTWVNYNGINTTANTTDAYINNGTNTTVSVWIKLDSDATDSENSQPVMQSGYIWLMAKNGGSCNLVYFRYLGDGAEKFVNTPCDTDNPEYTIENGDFGWHHIVGRYSNVGGQDYLDMFLDGVHVNNDLETAPPNGLYNQVFAIGERYSNHLGWFNGSITDLRVYNESVSYRTAFDLFMQGRYQDQPNTVIPHLYGHRYVGEEIADASSEMNSTLLYMILDYLNESGYETITDVDYYNWVNGNFVMPKYPVMISMDDQDTDGWLEMAAIMDDYDYKAMMALKVGDLTDATNLEVLELVNNHGWGIIAHSVTHCNHGFGSGGAPNYCNTTAGRKAEFEGTRDYFIANFSITPISYIYPYNDFGNKDVVTGTFGYSLYPEIQDECLSYYSLCFGDSYNTAEIPIYTNWDSFLETNMKNGSLHRTQVTHEVTLEQIDRFFNNTAGIQDKNLAFHYKGKENAGDTLHDVGVGDFHTTLYNGEWETNGETETIGSGNFSVSGEDITLTSNEFEWEEMTANLRIGGDTDNTAAAMMIRLVAILTIIAMLALMARRIYSDVK